MDFVELEVEGEQRTRWALDHGGEAMSFDRVLDAWATDPKFVERWVAQLAACPFQAFFFEMPPLVDASLDRRFEFVLVETEALARRRPDPHPFRHALARAEPALATSFANLGRNATLIAPTDRGADCTHLAVFSRTAEFGQQLALWVETAMAMRAELGSEPRWLSTSGLGVSWLHLRVDQRPKYYTHWPYRDARLFEDS